MKKEICTLFVVSLLILSLSFTLAEESGQERVTIHVFYGQGCPHCESLLSYLEDLKEEMPKLEVVKHEVYHNQEERELFREVTQRYQKKIEGVPTVFVDNKVIVGFSKEIKEELREDIEGCLSQGCTDPLKNKNSSNSEETIGDSSPGPDKKKGMQRLTIPIVVAAAAVDAINPCAFAVLIILMSAALAITDKRKALKFGLAFSASVYISYFLMGVGLFSALQFSGTSHYFYIFVTFLAVVVGLLNIKDYFWYGKGFLMEVPISWRPRMKKLLNSVTTPIGAFLVGFAVSLFELPCTGGPYIVILGLLAKEVTRMTGILYLLLYNLVFVSPLIILSLLIYKGLSTTENLEKIRKSKLRVLHLIAGILMLLIAGAMILALVMGWV